MLRPFVDRPVADLDAAGLVASQAAAHWGLDEPILLRASMNAIYRSGDVVLRGPGRPMDEAAMFAKFADCTQRQLPAETLRTLYKMLLQLETLRRLGAVTDCLAAV